MSRFILACGVMALTSSGAFAGGIDRSGQSIAFIFENGGYAEFSLGAADPSVSGVATAFSPTPAGVSGDMAERYSSFGAAFKQTIRDGLDVGLILDQPYGADVSYPAAPYFATGSTATLRSTALTAVAKYRLPSNVSILGGLRYQTFSAQASIPFIGGYTGISKTDGGVGYLVGVAYEKPEIALRVALTYNSKIRHKLATTEFGVLNSVTTVDTPQSLNLEFQSGVAANTLVFGSVRWVEWSQFAIDPANYPPTTPIVSYDDDTISYTLGVGRKFNENWSGAVTFGYERTVGGFASNLGPTDGYKSIGIGASYTKDNMKISFGARYVDIGDAQTTLVANLPAANFSGNSAVGYGIKVGFSF